MSYVFRRSGNFFVIPNVSERDTSKFLNDTSLQNIVDDEIYKISNLSILIIYGVLLATIAFVGMTLNLASLIVFVQKSMRSSVNFYLAGLSFFDAFLLLFSFLIFPTYAYCYHFTDGFWCKYFVDTIQVTYFLLNVMQTCHIWTLMAISIDRFVAVRWPLKVNEYLTHGKSTFVLIMITIFSIIYNTPNAFEFERMNNGTLKLTSLRKDHIYIVVYKSYCYLLFMFLIPTCLMIILNVYVTLSVRRSYVQKRQMSGKEEKERKSTIMAMVVVVTFLLLNMTANVTNCIEYFSSYSSSYHHHHHHQPIVVLISNLLITINLAINFFIYYALNLKFKQIFCKLFCCICYTPEKEYKFLAAYFSTMRPSMGSNLKHLNDTADLSNSEACGIISMRSIRRPLLRSQRMPTTIDDQASKLTDENRRPLLQSHRITSSPSTSHRQQSIHAAQSPYVTSKF